MPRSTLPAAESVSYGTYDLVLGDSRHSSVDGSFDWVGGSRQCDIYGVVDPAWKCDAATREAAETAWASGRVLLDDDGDAFVPFENFDADIIAETARRAYEELTGSAGAALRFDQEVLAAPNRGA